MAAKRARVPCGVGVGFWTARCSASKFDDAASARGRDFMMRTAGARIMSISGARRAQTSPGLPADAHDAGLWGAKMGGTTARCTNSRCPHLAQPLNLNVGGLWLRGCGHTVWALWFTGLVSRANHACGACSPGAICLSPSKMHIKALLQTSFFCIRPFAIA